MNRVFNQHWNLGAFEGLGDFLHIKRTHGGAGAQPNGVGLRCESALHVLGVTDLDHKGKANLGTHNLQPL